MLWLFARVGICAYGSNSLCREMAWGFKVGFRLVPWETRGAKSSGNFSRRIKVGARTEVGFVNVRYEVSQ
jgi:hypothetical protein